LCPGRQEEFWPVPRGRSHQQPMENDNQGGKQLTTPNDCLNPLLQRQLIQDGVVEYQLETELSKNNFLYNTDSVNAQH